MKTIVFAKRNLLEILKDPLASVFFIILPTILFIALKLIISSLGADIANVPQFEIKNLTAGMIIFSFSFITIFVGNNFAIDRDSSFLLRLKSSPMKSHNFILGYTIPSLIIAFIQEVIMVIIGIIFGLNLSIHTLFFMLLILPVSLLFIGFGLLFGCLFNFKAIGPLSSVVPTAASLLGGIFFPLALISNSNPFKIICSILPFYPAITVGSNVLNGNYDILLNYFIVMVYTLVFYLLSITIFSIKLKSDKI